MISILPALVSLLAVAPPKAPPASDPTFCVAPPPVVSAEEAVRRADVIVHAVAMRDRTGAAADSVGLDDDVPGWLEFQVVAVLKGRNVPAKLYIQGFLMAMDDFNREPVPYRHQRGGWSGGACYPYGYRRGGEFLLLLRKVRGRLTPYYASAPTNEQVRGADDPWVLWVRARLAAAR